MTELHEEWLYDSNGAVIMTGNEDDISAREAEIRVYDSWIQLYDCEANGKRFECEAVSSRKGQYLYSTEKARKAVLQYLKSKGYRFSPREDEQKFALGQFDDMAGGESFYIIK